MEEQCYCTMLRNAARKVSAHYDEALAPIGVGVAQFGLLRKIARVEPVTLSELGRLSELDRSTVGRNVRVLERMDLVLLSRGDADQRETHVLLTLAGRDALAKGEELWCGAQRSIEARLGANGAAELLGTLNEL
ncbi:MarR family winged helix-turn-helix transcriptional regulator [Mesorhizobium sp. ORS 3428]|uniref:MarR family winged helix-turn-helix transcriptional regulator n=1 Tax=Mesorhizobium sp. ORS 3428 TaxID=540997 RepID=UPI000595EE88|nr:MarR family winged helix-turn-helix transcriptional regulator [Mesorhizobium sp. ORS 3428]OHV89861.1 MarR family transcriptional regulator [Mesorhizobium sp. ORS 3428]